jgi:hypothetical protein
MMKKTKFALSAIALLMTSSVFATDGKLIDINYTDEDGFGFNSVEPYSVEGNPAKTLGEARKNALEYAVNVYSTRFYSKQSFTWDIGFNPNAEGSEATTNVLEFYEPLENMEKDGPSHHFLNPVNKKDEHLNERNIHTLTQYLAHTEESSNSNAAISSIIRSDHTFVLNDIESEDSLFSYVNKTLTNSFGFSVTNNIHKDSVEDSNSETPAESEDVVRQNHQSYFNKFLVNESGDSLYGMEIEDVVTSVKAGVYFRTLDKDDKLQDYSKQTTSFLLDNAIIKPNSDLGIPMYSNTLFDPILEVEEDEAPECLTTGLDENGVECDYEVTVEEEVFHENMEMLFSDSYSSKINRELTSHLLCDIGWCSTSATEDNDFTGKVIDLSVNVISDNGKFTINANRTANLEFTISDENQLNYPITSAVIEVAIPSEITINKLNDPLLNSDKCTIETIDINSESEEVISYQLLKCNFETLEEDENLWVRLSAPDGGDYSISSRVYSNASNVDKFGLNNLNYQEISFVPNGDQSDKDGDEEKSGGSFGYLMFFLALPLAILRRFKK